MPAYNIVPYGDHRSQFVEVWPTAGQPIGTAILIHGGYWRDRYGLDLMHPMAAHLVDGGWTVINIEYRRLTEPDPDSDRPQAEHGIWPAMSSDVLAAIDTAGRQEPPLVVVGHSAGGHLALWAAASRSATLDGVVALAPVADLFEADRRGLSDGVVRRVLGGDGAAKQELYRAASPLALVPLGVPQLIVHGSQDDAVPQRIGIDYAAAATAAGDAIDLLAPPGVDHFHIIDPGHRIWRSIDRWLEAVAAGAGR